MGNRHRGTVSATLGNETYQLRLATNELVDLEEEFGKPTTDFLKEFFQQLENETLNIKFMRSVFRAALSSDRPDISDREAGEIMSELGLPEAARLIGEVIKASMPDQEETARPPKAAARRK